MRKFSNPNDLPTIRPLHWGQDWIPDTQSSQTKWPLLHCQTCCPLLKFSKQTGHSGVSILFLLDDLLMVIFAFSEMIFTKIGEIKELSRFGLSSRILAIASFLFLKATCKGVSPFLFLTFQSTLGSLFRSSTHLIASSTVMILSYLESTAIWEYRFLI